MPIPNLTSQTYVDNALAGKLDLAGGTMTGGLTLSASGIIFSDATYLTTAPAGSTLAADQLTAGVVTANPVAGPTAAGDVLMFDGTALVWAPGGGGGSVAWGGITGTLSDQTDLQTALNAKAPTDSPTFTGNVTAGGNLVSTAASADEGGEIQLAIPTVNTTIAGVISIDVYQNKVRFFENGGSNRGAYIDITAMANSVGTNLLTAPKTVNNIDMSVSNYTLSMSDANNIVNVSAGDGSSSGYVIYIPASSSVNFPIGTEVLFTCGMDVGTSMNYINPEPGGYVVVLQSSNQLNATFMRKAVKLATDLWMISTQI